MYELVVEPLLFFFFVFTALYVPGKFFFTTLKLELKSPSDVFVSIGMGIILFTLAAYIASWLKIDWLLIPLIIAVDFLALCATDWKPKKIEKKQRQALIHVGFLSLIFSISMLMTGKFGDSLIIRGDDLWHVALINELKVHFPPDNPSFAALPLRGYHFFYDFLTAKISNFMFISPLSLHIHLMPLFFALMWGLGLYSLMYQWTKKIAAGLWGAFLGMYGGSFAFLLLLKNQPIINLDAGFGIGQVYGVLFNPSMSASIVLLLTILILLHNFLTTKRNTWLIPLTLCLGLISMFKVYAGIILLGSFLCLSLILILKRKFVMIKALAGIGILFLSTYWIFVGGMGGLIFHPLWAPEALLLSWPWYFYENKIAVYSQLHLWHRIIWTETVGILAFLLGNLGTRLFGMVGLFILLKKSHRKYFSLFSFSLVIMTIISITIPLLFIQTGKVFEIIQMGQYYILFCALFAAYGFAVFFSLKMPRLLKVLLIALIVSVTLPSAVATIIATASLVNTKQSLSSPYQQAMHYLKQADSYNKTVLELPAYTIQATDKDVLDWYKSTSSPALTAFANKRTYVNNDFINSPGIDYEKRLHVLRNLMAITRLSATKSVSEKQFQTFLATLKEEHITYIYTTYPLFRYNKENSIMKLYGNKGYYIYKII